ncbi:hypothetical protein NM688_g9345 [Phlebia brevispora]|uniref:Uncharacterized protein n=1 Tax=Phlebia brevispora TaxID=194682 RepID=A0ACC1RK92_9APHY|nr:hypothetical protein NM688_g9345 [Phlebia brevispora]
MSTTTHSRGVVELQLCVKCNKQFKRLATHVAQCHTNLKLDSGTLNANGKRVMIEVPLAKSDDPRRLGTYHCPAIGCQISYHSANRLKHHWTETHHGMMSGATTAPARRAPDEEDWDEADAHLQQTPVLEDYWKDPDWTVSAHMRHKVKKEGRTRKPRRTSARKIERKTKRKTEKTSTASRADPGLATSQRFQEEDRNELTPSQPFVYQFLEQISQPDNNFVEHAQLFVDLGIFDRSQFQTLFQRPGVMAKIHEKLEKSGLSFFAISVIEDALNDYFGPGANADA